MKKGAGVILYSYDKDNNICVLLGKRIYNPGKGNWGIPGGGMEECDGDDCQNTAIRECFEETTIKIEKPLIEIDRLHFPHLEWITYIAEVAFDKRNLFVSEMEESAWFNIDNLPSPLVNKIDEQLIELKRILYKK